MIQSKSLLLLQHFTIISHAFQRNPLCPQSFCIRVYREMNLYIANNTINGFCNVWKHSHELIMSLSLGLCLWARVDMF